MVDVTADVLLAFVERIEKYSERIEIETDYRKEVYDELKGAGYDPAIVRKVVAIRKRKADDVAEEEAILELYRSALGMT